MKTKILLLLLLFIAIVGVSTLMIPKARAMSANKEDNLGFDYFFGQGVPQNWVKANYWYKKAAMQGNKNAESNLGNAYLYAQGVPQNSFKAIYWYKKAMAQGSISAEYGLGMAYILSSKSVPHNYVKGIYWIKKMAGQGYAAAIMSLAGITTKKWITLPAVQRKAILVFGKFAYGDKYNGVGVPLRVVGNGLGRSESQSALNYTITGATFGTQLQSSLLSYMNGSGYKSNITANMIIPFSVFVAGSTNIKEVEFVISRVSVMVNMGDLKNFNQLTRLYADYLIQKNG
jgi:TPR repeat protein